MKVLFEGKVYTESETEQKKSPKKHLMVSDFLKTKRYPFKGKWVSESGHTLWFKLIPLINVSFVIYKPLKGRYRFLSCYEHENNNCRFIGLHYLGLMESMMYLWQACDIKTREIILIPEIEQGPESNWIEEDFGFPWLFPLAVFRQEK